MKKAFRFSHARPGVVGLGGRGLLVVKRMWGDTFQVFDSAQANNPGGPDTDRCSHLWFSVFLTEHYE